jgi:hypothetical protein
MSQIRFEPSPVLQRVDACPHSRQIVCLCREYQTAIRDVLRTRYNVNKCDSVFVANSALFYVFWIHLIRKQGYSNANESVPALVRWVFYILKLAETGQDWI